MAKDLVQQNQDKRGNNLVSKEAGRSLCAEEALSTEVEGDTNLRYRSFADLVLDNRKIKQKRKYVIFKNIFLKNVFFHFIN